MKRQVYAPGRSRGSTLLAVLLAIAVVVLAILVLVPMYRDYTIQSEVREASEAVAALREPVDSMLASGNGNIETESLPLPDSTLLADDLSVSFNDDGGGTVIATLGDEAHPRVQDVAIRLARRPDGVWRCEVDAVRNPSWRDVYLPKGCRRYVR